jgi:hypothetical protein
MYYTDRKRAHATIKGDAHTAQTLSAIRTPSGYTITDTAGVLTEAAGQYSKIVDKQYTSSPASTPPPPPPWSAASGLDIDPFHLRTVLTTASPLAPSPDRAEPAPLAGLLTRAVYNKVLTHRSNRKACGPDGVPNEILKAMPTAYHDMFFDLCRLQLLHRRTYLQKHSYTVLLHKKGDATDIKNYRPIGLENTALKLWTALLAELIQQYAEIGGILSPSQSGFRTQRRCLHQIMSVMNVIEDARITNSPLYIMYLDMTNAFGSVDHGKLSEILTMLGLPADCVDTVTDLYTNFTTSLVLSAGITQPITFKRGTLQGDGLSPLLFILYLEPLIQWITAGKHGYKLHSLARTSTETTSVSAFADDLALLASSLQEIQHMLKKVELYCKWAHLSLNASKCVLTGTDRNKSTVGQLRARAQSIKIGAHAIPFQPASTPYKYLGVMLTLSLAGLHQTELLKQAVLTKTTAITNSPAAQSIVSEVISSLIVSQIEYTLPTCILTATGLSELQSLLDRAGRAPFGLHKSSSKAMLHMQRSAGGLGLPNLHCLASSGALEACMIGLNDDGPLGKQCI